MPSLLSGVTASVCVDCEATVTGASCRSCRLVAFARSRWSSAISQWRLQFHRSSPGASWQANEPMGQGLLATCQESMLGHLVGGVVCAGSINRNRQEQETVAQSISLEQFAKTSPLFPADWMGCPAVSLCVSIARQDCLKLRRSRSHHSKQLRHKCLSRNNANNPIASSDHSKPGIATE